MSVRPDPSGDFRITLNVDFPSFVTLYIPKKASGTLLVEPGKTYTVDFNPTSKDGKFIVTGENSEGQNIYNKFLNPEFNMNVPDKFLKDSVANILEQKIENAKENEISLFKSLLERGKISENFLNLIKLDRDCFYNALQSKVASDKFFESNRTKSKKLKAESLALWAKALEQTSPTDQKFVRSPWFYCLATEFINYKNLQYKFFYLKELRKTMSLESLHSGQIALSKKYLTGKKQEYFEASYIYYFSSQNKENSKELISLYNNFKRNYPESKYTPYLRSIITPIIQYHNKIAKNNLNKAIKFIDNYQKINTFDELISKFKGKRVYIDIWGTWCGPCKEEFKHSEKLKKFLDSKGIETLYICEGDNSKEDTWKGMTNYYELDGYHMRTNKKLLADIIDKFGKDGSFYYPRYILVDKNGHVIKSKAKKPSQMNYPEAEPSGYQNNFS